MPKLLYITRTMKALARTMPKLLYIIRYRPRTDRILYVARTMPNFVYITHPIGAELPSEGADKKCPII
tara:strand:+ start:558 stop:761 length:204 start_codon:yes stop_codon:yes gene_type:complete